MYQLFMSYQLILGDASITHSYQESTHRLRGLSTEPPDLRGLPVTWGQCPVSRPEPKQDPWRRLPAPHGLRTRAASPTAAPLGAHHGPSPAGLVLRLLVVNCVPGRGAPRSLPVPRGIPAPGESLGRGTLNKRPN